MAIRLTIRGIEITVSSTAEAAALIREMTEAPAPKIGRPRIKPRPQELFPDTPSADHQLAHDFLFRIASAEAKGISTEEVMKVLKVDTGKGVGGRCVRINNILAKLGFTDPSEIYRNPRLADGNRVWRSGPKIAEALLALKNGR